MPQIREKFTTRVNSEILSTIRQLAGKEGCPLQALVDEALFDLIEKRKRAAAPRAHVVSAYLASHEKFGSLYQKVSENQFSSGSSTS